MADLTAIGTLISSFSAAQTIAKGMLELKTTADVQGKVVELQGVIMAAQTSALSAQVEQSNLMHRIDTLEGELAELRSWNADKARYALTSIEQGTFVYALRPEAANGEPPHWICPNCYQVGKKSLLQHQGTFYGDQRHECPRCKLQINVSGSKSKPPIQYPPSGIA